MSRVKDFVKQELTLCIAFAAALISCFFVPIKSCDEGELEWVEKQRLLSLPIWEGDKIFLRLLDSEQPFFSLKLRYEGERLVAAALNGKAMTL